MMAFGFLLPLRLAQVFFAWVVVGLSGYGIGKTIPKQDIK